MNITAKSSQCFFASSKHFFRAFLCRKILFTNLRRQVRERKLKVKLNNNAKHIEFTLANKTKVKLCFYRKSIIFLHCFWRFSNNTLFIKDCYDNNLCKILNFSRLFCCFIKATFCAFLYRLKHRELSTSSVRLF